MSREIDERIVAMHFDNAQFERGAKQSLKTLDALREGLNLDGAADSFSQISKATSNQLGLKKTQKQVGVFSKSLGTMGKMAKSVFNATTFPIRSLTNSLSTLGKYARTVFGFDLAHQLVSTGENLVRAFTIEPVKAGWSEYELKMDSIKTIMSGSGESLETVKYYLEELNKYADDTVYSFSDMTSNIGKFVNNGVKLSDATAAMKGISNAAADAGQGTQQASMAMYNLSQAISMGKLTTMDWKSIENANMSTQKFKQTFIEVGVAQGKLKKEGDKYFTATGKKMEVTAENFRNTLSEGWADTDVILNALKIFSGELNAEALAALGFEYREGDETSEAYRLAKIGEEAKKAATEVRTFSKMMDALKEAVQSGWAMSFEYIFGDLEEGTALWTSLNERFGKALAATSEARNNILLGWRGMRKNEEGELEKIEGAIDGREVLIETFNNFLDVFSKISGAFSSAWSTVFGSLTSERLLSATQWIHDLSQSFLDWLGSADDSTSNISKITSGLEGLLSVVRFVAEGFKTAGSFIWSFIQPLVSFFVDAFGKAGGMLKSLLSGDFVDVLKRIKNAFKSLTKEKVSGWFVKVGDAVKGLWTSVKSSATTWLRDHGLGGVVDWISGAFSTIESGLKSAYESISTSPIFQTVQEFFTNLWNSISGWFTRQEGEDQSGFEAFIASVGDIFNQVKKALEDAYTAVSEWISSNEFIQSIGSFFSDLWTSISGWFTRQDGQALSGFEQAIATVGSVFESVKGALVDAYAAVSEWISSNEFVQSMGNFFSDLWASISGWFTRQDGQALSGFEQAIATVSGVFESVKGALVDSYNAVVKWMNENEFLQTIGSFFSNIWGSISGWFTNVDSEGHSGFDNFISKVGSIFQEVGSALQTAYDTVKQSIENFSESNIFQTVKDFFSGIWNSISGFFVNPEGGESGFDVFIKNIGGWFSQIGSAVNEAWNNLTGKDLTFQSVIETISGWLDSVKTGILNAWDTISGWPGWDEVGKFFADVWGWISEKLGLTGKGGRASSLPPGTKGIVAAGMASDVMPLKGVKNVADDTKETVQEVTSAVTSVFEPLTNLINAVKGWPGWTTLGSVISQIFDAISGLISNIAENTDIGKIGSLLIRFKDFIIAVFTSIMDVLEWFVHKDPETGAINIEAWKVGVGAIVAIIGVIGKMVVAKKMSNWVGNTESFGSSMLKFAIAVALIAAAIYAIGSIPSDVLWTGVGVVAGIMVAIGALMVIMNKKPDPKTKRTKLWTGILGKLVSWLGMIGLVWVALEKLPAVIEALGKVDLQPGVLLEVFGSIAALVAIMSLVVIGLSKLGIDSLGGGVIKGMAIVLLLVAMVMGFAELMGWAISEIDPELKFVDKVVEFFGKLGELAGSLIGGIAGAIVGAYEGAKNSHSGNADASDMMHEFTEMLKSFGEEGMDLVSALTMMDRVLDTMDRFADNRIINDAGLRDNMSWLLRVWDEYDSWQYESRYGNSAGGAMITFIENMITAYSNISDKIEELETTEEQFNKISSAMSAFREMMSMIAMVYALANPIGMNRTFDAGYIQGLSKFIGDLSEGASGLQEFLSSANGLALKITTEFNGAISKAAEDIDMTPLTTAMANKIMEDGGPIVQALATVFNLDGLFGEEWKSFTGEGGFLSGALKSLGLDGVFSSLSGLSGSMGSLNFSDKFMQMLGFKDAEGNMLELPFESLINNEKITGWLDGIDAVDPNEWLKKFGLMDVNGNPLDVDTLLSEQGVDLKISPVWDTEGMPDLFTEEGLTVSGTVHIDSADISSIVSAVDKNTVAVRGTTAAVNSLGGRISSLESAIRSMRFVLNTGAVAGAVDSALGMKASQYARNAFARP